MCASRGTKKDLSTKYIGWTCAHLHLAAERPNTFICSFSLEEAIGYGIYNFIFIKL